MNAQKIVLARPIAAAPVAADFALVDDGDARPPEAGQVNVRLVYLSLDPFVGSILRGRHLGEASPGVGDLIPGLGLGQVVASQAPAFAAGDFVVGPFGWRSAATLDASALRTVDAGAEPLSAYLGVAGMPGLAAYAGVTRLARVRVGDTVLVSSAAGAVGGVAGQIARIEGAARVIGIAGGAEKCRLVVERYGFDDCIDYRSADFRDRLAAALPEGASVYFDNVGGEVLDAALANLSHYGRIVLCGLASQYHADQRPAGPNPGLYIAKRAQLFGLVVYDFYPEADDYARKAGGWIREGRINVAEHRAEGLAAAPALFETLMRGENLGKCIVAVGPEAI